jgi:hypothetical protein
LVSVKADSKKVISFRITNESNVQDTKKFGQLLMESLTKRRDIDKVYGDKPYTIRERTSIYCTTKMLNRLLVVGKMHSSDPRDVHY